MRHPRLKLASLLLGAAAATVPMAAAGRGTAAKAVATAPAADWSKTVVATPEGGFRMGSPNARLKLVEYGSLTCSHCAHFAHDGVPQLVAKYVRTGRASYEFRNYILNGADIAATLVARCAGAKGFFGAADAMYASQGQWMAKVSGLPASEKERLRKLPEAERIAALAKAAGLTAIGARHGVTPAMANACLKDPAALARLGKMAEAAAAQGVEGTPTFFVNGTNVGSHTWASLEPVLASWRTAPGG